jgi:hypothetical protein
VTSGRSCSLARRLFFEAETFGVHEVKDRVVVDLDPALGQFDHQPPQGEIAITAAFKKPVAMLAAQDPGLASTHPIRLEAAALPQPAHPGDHGADPNPKPGRRLPARQTLVLNRTHNPFAKINR